MSGKSVQDVQLNAANVDDVTTAAKNLKGAVDSSTSAAVNPAAPQPAKAKGQAKKEGDEIEELKGMLKPDNIGAALILISTAFSNHYNHKPMLSQISGENQNEKISNLFLYDFVSKSRLEIASSDEEKAENAKEEEERKKNQKEYNDEFEKHNGKIPSDTLEKIKNVAYNIHKNAQEKNAKFWTKIEDDNNLINAVKDVSNRGNNLISNSPSPKEWFRISPFQVLLLNVVKFAVKANSVGLVYYLKALGKLYSEAKLSPKSFTGEGLSDAKCGDLEAYKKYFEEYAKDPKREIYDKLKPYVESGKELFRKNVLKNCNGDESKIAGIKKFIDENGTFFMMIGIEAYAKDSTARLENSKKNFQSSYSAAILCFDQAMKMRDQAEARESFLSCLENLLVNLTVHIDQSALEYREFAGLKKEIAERIATKHNLLVEKYEKFIIPPTKQQKDNFVDALKKTEKDVAEESVRKIMQIATRPSKNVPETKAIDDFHEELKKELAAE